ncbi:hypothetical protein GCM10009557_71550 [Virgisporangium ochraceum]
MSVGTARAYTVSEVSSQTGLSAHTLRWYEQVGLLDPVHRDAAGRRRYSDDDLGRLSFLLKLRSTGMPVRDMIRFVELSRLDNDAGVAEKLQILVDHRERVLTLRNRGNRNVIAGAKRRRSGCALMWDLGGTAS